MGDARLWACSECDTVLNVSKRGNPDDHGHSCGACGSEGEWNWRFLGTVSR